jgi:hypothetical protein
MSQNYSNMTYFRNGIQITALNLQYISNPWYLNRAVFLPKTGVPCTPNDMKTKMLCKTGWKNGKDEVPLAYRLKPLWLLGLIPNPGLYTLNVKVTKCSRVIEDPSSGSIKLEDVSNDYQKVNLMYGLTETTKNNSIQKPIVMNDIDVTVPFFVLDIIKPSMLGMSSEYKTGIEIPWSFTNCGIDKINKLTVDVYQIQKTLMGSLNKVELKDKCENSQLFNTHKQLRVELEYSWTFQSEIKEMTEYNKAVRELRELYNKPVSHFLQNLVDLNKFQNELAEKLANQPSKVSVEELIDEDTEALEYETEMNKLKSTAKAVNDLNTLEV